MTEVNRKLSLYEGVKSAGLSWADVWLGHVSIGGSASEEEVEAYVLGLLIPDGYQHDLIAQAINEQFLSAGGDHPVAYWGD